MPSAAIPTVSPSFRPFADFLRRLAALPAAVRRLGRQLSNAWFREAPCAAAPYEQVPTRLQRDELMAMSSHELSDLGIGRSEIPALFSEPSSWNAGWY
ncbi:MULTISPECIES: DUF1127 domain-containing protein [unclassified Polaromonas]|uniref:DUF1127 domain-containing protein n=1 Tax=unclassified Polaromonas TaxID=2638319 RepID=UPI0013DDD319|nr:MULTISPECIES: DUF1127 domain-containing protein [unclassified Polaromonas]